MKKITNYITKIFGIMSLVSTFPNIYKITNIKQIIILFILLVSSFLFTSGFINNIENNVLKTIIFYFTTAYFLFLIFNILVRIFNITYRMVPYFLTQSHILINRQVIICYYLYNFICLVLSLLLVFKILYFLTLFDKNILDYILIYIFFVSILGSLLYIDYISHLDIVVSEIKLNRLMYFLLSGQIIILFLPILGLVNINLVSYIFNDKNFLNIYYYHSHIAPDNDKINISSNKISDLAHISLMDSGERSQNPTNSNVDVSRPISRVGSLPPMRPSDLYPMYPCEDKIRKLYFLIDSREKVFKDFPFLFIRQSYILTDPRIHLSRGEIYFSMNRFLKYLEVYPLTKLIEIDRNQFKEEIHLLKYTAKDIKFIQTKDNVREPYNFKCDYNKKLLGKKPRFPSLPVIFEEKED
jgi:hypothetical protein